MKTGAKQPSRVPVNPRDAIAFAVATILAGAASQAGAQAVAAGDEIDEVVVTGFRHSLETSIAAKKESDSITESITAEDIGKLPDVSIADALKRLPGLAAQRIGGRASVISIRGLGPRYGSTLLNGREMVSTGDNRSVEYDQFPSELINSATVYKTPDGTLIGQGLSGTLDMKTVRPLDFASRQANVNVRGNWNSNGQLNADTTDKGGRFSGSYIDQFADHTIGVALGYAYLNTPSQEKHYKSWWWADTGNWGAPMAGSPPGAIDLQGFETGAASNKAERNGLMAVVEFKPNDTLHSTVDLYYSSFTQVENRRTLMSDLSTWGGTSYLSATTTQVDGNTIVTGGTLTGMKPVDLSDYANRHDKLLAAGWNTELKLGSWTAVADLSYSSAKRTEYDAELSSGLAGPVTLSNARINPFGDGLSYFTPSGNYADPAQNLLRDPEGWGRDGRAQFPHVKDELKSIRLGAGREFDSFFSRLDFGVNYSNRTKDMNRTEVYYYLKNGRTPVSVSNDLLIKPTDLSFAGVGGGVIAYNFMNVLAKYYDSGVPAALDQAPGRIWNVDEKVTTAFAKLSLHAADWKVPLRGNIGLQVINAKQQSTGIDWQNNAPLPTTGKKSYTDILPSLNLNFELPKDAYLRWGFAKVLARPNMEDMRAGFSGISISNAQSSLPGHWSGNGGNPWLEPWRADAYDVSLEKYFGKHSYVSAAYFYKNIKNFVYSRTVFYDFSGFQNPTGNPGDPGYIAPTSPIGDLTTLANGHGGLVAGVELAFTVDFGILDPRLEGFGIQANGSDIRSSLHEDNNLSKPLDGLSGQLTNVTAYYEKHGFSLRIANTSRSRFVTTVRGTYGANDPSSIEAESILDLQIGYDFQTGSLKGLSLLGQVNNLNDEPYKTRVGISTGGSNPNATLPERYTTYGREYLLGFSYKIF